MANPTTNLGMALPSESSLSKIDLINGAFQTLDALFPGGYPVFVGARVYNNANISVISATDTLLTFNTERYDTNTIHSTATNTGRLTFPFAGKWRITGAVRWAANATGIRLLMICLNGLPGTGIILGADERTNLGASLSPIQQVTADWNVAANDYAILVAYQDSGGALNVTFNASYSPEFWCQYLGQ